MPNPFGKPTTEAGQESVVETNAELNEHVDESIASGEAPFHPTGSEAEASLELTPAPESEGEPQEAEADPELTNEIDPAQQTLPIEPEPVVIEPGPVLEAPTPVVAHAAPVEVDTAVEVVDEQAIPAIPGLQENSTVFSSHPLRQFTMGRFEFKDGILVLNGREVQLFERLLAGQPASIKVMVKKVDPEAARKMLYSRKQPAMHQGVDTSDRGPKADPRD